MLKVLLRISKKKIKINSPKTLNFPLNLGRFSLRPYLLRKLQQLKCKGVRLRLSRPEAVADYSGNAAL